jgi:hypothetical protein
MIAFASAAGNNAAVLSRARVCAHLPARKEFLVFEKTWKMQDLSVL